MVAKTPQLKWVDRLYVGLLLTIFGLIILHAPLTIWLGSLFPVAEVAIKAWKEVLMIPAVGLGIFLLAKYHRWDILNSPWAIVPIMYGLIHVLLVSVSYSNLTSVIAGLLIDVRYVVFFVLVFVMIQLYPWLRQLFLRVFLVGALLVGTFAILQVFVLPPDILSVIGYGDTTISPYLTVDENSDYIRINSTLRGPNPLGAYVVIVLALAAAYWLRVKRPLLARPVAITAWLSIGALVALWASYSRSALVAVVIALGIVFISTVGRRLNRWAWIGLFVAAFAVAGALFVARDTSFISNVILHENEGTGASINSNEGHADSLSDGTYRLFQQPLGAGIGSTGSASLYTDSPAIIENQYLFIAHEVGWIGLLIFLLLFGMILGGLWQRRVDWLALAVFASGIGLALIGLLLPVWVDDTVAIIWWGLAALALGGVYDGAIHKTTKRTA